MTKMHYVDYSFRLCITTSFLVPL